MVRKSHYEIAKQILRLLKDGKERSIKTIASEIGSQWDTTKTALDFLEEIGLVKQRFGKATYMKERLFFLAK